MKLNKNKNKKPQSQANLEFVLILITKELDKPFKDPRYIRKEIDPTQNFIY